MKKGILLALLLSQSAYSAESLKCQFGIVNVPILLSETELKSMGEIGEYSKINFQGAPTKTIPNVLMPLGTGERFKFQLDEGFGDNNILITVYEPRVDQQTYSAIAENPQTDLFKKMQGQCQQAIGLDPL